MRKIKYYCFLALLLSVLCLNKAYANAIKKVFVFYGKPKSEISLEIKKCIDKNKGKLFKYDVEKGYYYFQPRSIIRTYIIGDYILLGLKQIENDTYLYTQTTDGAEYYLDGILNHLKKQGFICFELPDDQLKNKMESFTNNYINSYKDSDFYGENKIIENTPLSKEEKQKNFSEDTKKSGKNSKDTETAKIPDNENMLDYNTTWNLIKNNYNNQIINKPLVIPEKLTKKDTEYYERVNEYTLDAFKNAIFYINTNKYSPVDSNFEQVQNGTYSCYGVFLIDSYDIKKNDLIFTYRKKDGNLKSITIITSKNFPRTLYHYNYPDGALNTVDVNLSPALSFSFNEKGELINYEPYMKTLDKKIYGNWQPPYHFLDFRYLHNTVQFVVNKKGELLSSEIIRTSGDEAFDESVLVTIKKSAPFAPLPSFNRNETIELKYNFDSNHVENQHDFSSLIRTLLILTH